MKKVFILFLLPLWVLAAKGLEDLPSWVLLDSNGDGVMDSSLYWIKLEKNDLPYLILASEISYRLGYEAGEFVDLTFPKENKILIKSSSNISSDEAILEIKGEDLIISVGGPQGCRAAAQFFWRYPYVWKLPPGKAPTWKEVIKEIREALQIKGRISLRKLWIKAPADRVTQSYLEKGQILEAEFFVEEPGNLMEKVEDIRAKRKEGSNPYVLNYAYIAKLTFTNGKEKVSLERFGAPQEYYKPSYGIFPPFKRKGKIPGIIQVLSSPVALLVSEEVDQSLILLAFRIGLAQQEAHFPLIFTAEKQIPRGRSIISIGKTSLFEDHLSKGLYKGFCFEKGEKGWLLRADCVKDFATSFLFPALNKERNLYFADFYVKLLQNWLPPAIQEKLAAKEKGEPFITGKIYGKKKAFQLQLTEKDEGARLLRMLKGKKFDRVIAYVSESPARRKALAEQIKILTGGEAIVRSAYKSGFFWIVEEVLPALQKLKPDQIKIYFKKASPGGKRIKQTEIRWLAELYPVDEILSARLNLPFQSIKFIMEENQNLYRVEAFKKGNKVFDSTFNPPVVNEEGIERVAGWVKGFQGEKEVFSERLRTDPELAWEFYTSVVLPELKKFIIKKTNNKPAWDKQPFFSYLEFRFEAPEPDFPLEIDQEMISSLEALHDEIYFYTLHYIAELLQPDAEGGSVRRNLRPGAILPFVKNSVSGMKLKVTLYDFRRPGIYDGGKLKKAFYPGKKPACEISGWSKKSLAVDCNFKNERDFLLYSKAFAEGDVIEFPLPELTLTLKFKDFKRRIKLKGKFRIQEEQIKVDWTSPLSPRQAYSIARSIKYAWPAGKSFLGRVMWVVEKIKASTPRYSPIKFLSAKPSVLFNSRQHANEVSSTSYLLRFLLEEKDYSPKINLIANPVENPDGAVIALRMMEEESPHHSLHAGRYNALGIEVGYYTSKFSPWAPEGYVRNILRKRWKPDLLLNLHGYPSHEWVQQFTGYIPFPYWDYWIPRGLFLYFNSSENPLNREFSSRSLKLLSFLAKRLSKDPIFAAFNKKLYNRYYRWAVRWNPHSFKLELHEAQNIYAKDGRRLKILSSTEETLVSQTPELMDETATGDFLKYLMAFGRKYLRANLDFLLTQKSEVLSIHEEKGLEISLKRIRKRW